MNTVYIGRDNALVYTIKEGGAVADISAVTRMVVTVGTASVDSGSVNGVLDWTTTAGQLSIVAGLIGDLAAGHQTLRILAYAPDWPDGVVLGEDLVNVAA